MISICKFDAKTDIKEVVPDLAISIELAINTGIIKDTATTAPYTEEKSTDEVGHYLHDPIDIAMAAGQLDVVMAAGAAQTQTDENE